MLVDYERLLSSVAESEFLALVIKDGIITVNYGMMIRANEDKVF